jgi:hypothetical protein
MTNQTQTKDLSQMIDQLKSINGWNDAQLEQATKLLCAKFNDSKVTLKNQIKAGSFYHDYENHILAGRKGSDGESIYGIGVDNCHEIAIEIYYRGNLEDFDSEYKWEDFMENPNLVISEIQALRSSLGLK